MTDGLTVGVVSDQISVGLAELQTRLGDLTPVFNVIGEKFESNVNIRFDTKRDPNGQPWAPWAASTRAAYDKADTVAGKGGKKEVKRKGTLLERTGHMRDGLSYVADATALDLGFDRKQAAYHEFGTKRMPRRGLILGDPEAGTLAAPDETMIMATIEAWMTR